MRVCGSVVCRARAAVVERMRSMGGRVAQEVSLAMALDLAWQSGPKARSASPSQDLNQYVPSPPAGEGQGEGECQPARFGVIPGRFASPPVEPGIHGLTEPQ